MGGWIFVVLIIGAIVYMTYFLIFVMNDEGLGRRGKVYFLLGILAVNLGLPLGSAFLGLEWLWAIPPAVLFSPIVIAALIVIVSLR